MFTERMLMARDAYLVARRYVLQGLAVGAMICGWPGAVAAAPKPQRRTFQGLFPIGSTPVDANNRIDFDQLANQVTFLRRGRVPGIAWPQIASGWTVLTEAERMQGAEALVQAGRGGETAIVIGVQSPDPAAVRRYAAQAERIGADAIICIPPADVKDEAELLRYYQRVGQSTALPLFVQAVGTMSVDLIVKMFETIPTMRYVKDEAGEPLERVRDLLQRTGGKINDFSGRGANTMITEMERGFVGACPFVSLADVYQACWEAWHANDHARAFQIFGAIEAANTMFAQSSPEALIARGVFKPGTKLRAAPAAAGSSQGRYLPATSSDEIRRVMDDYLRPYMRA